MTGILLAMLITWVITGDWLLGLNLGLLYNLLRLLTHYAHERVWNLWSWGIVDYTRAQVIDLDGIPSPPVERRLRTILRLSSWRVFGVITAFVLAWLVSGDLGLGVGFGLLYNGLRFVMHYFHDRWWGTLRWGLYLPDEPEAEDAAP